ncbi:hypothetical protein Tco_0904154 [Tanacetum coccineum]
MSIHCFDRTEIIRILVGKLSTDAAMVDVSFCRLLAYLSIHGSSEVKVEHRLLCQVSLEMKFETLQVPRTTCRTPAVRPRDQDDAHPEGENSVKWQNTSEYEAHVTEESFGQVYEKEQDLLYLKKGSSGPEKIVLSLYKFPAIIFNDVDIEEQTSRWIIQLTRTYWELGHEHKFITEIVARRANECIVSITESDYKNLNKNDIEDMYFKCRMGKVHDFQLGIESYQQKVNLTAPTISFPGIEKHKMFSIIYEPMHGIIYKNSKKEKRVTQQL